MEPKNQLILPPSVVGPIDIGRMLREAEKLHDFMEQAAIRKTGEPMMLPKTSRLLDEFFQMNHLNALQDADRLSAVETLKSVRKNAPVVHLSFSADPTPQFMQKIIEWLRANTHPHLLVRVGLQPNIGAGCVMRTTNKYFDFSLRQHFAKHYQFFVDKLHEVVDLEETVTGEVVTTAPVAEPPKVAA